MIICQLWFLQCFWWNHSRFGRSDGRLSIKTILTPETLQNGEGTKKMVLNYAKFVRSWSADEAIKDFRDAK